MTLDISFSKKSSKTSTVALILVADDKKLGKQAAQLDKNTNGYISAALKKSQTFSGAHGESLILTLPGKNQYDQIIIGGLGKASALNHLAAENAGGKLFPVLDRAGSATLSLYIDVPEKAPLKLSELAARLAYGIKLRSYKFDKYTTKKKDSKTKSFSKLEIITEKPGEFKALEAIAEGVFFARNLVNEPPNVVYPDLMAKRIVQELKPLGVEIEILDEKKMKKLGMGALLAIGMGSDNLPRMVIMRWNGAGKEKPLALVGKGVTFDTGGISIKPAAGMEEMKMDMAGAAAVIGTMRSLAQRKAKANVVGIVGLAENMISGHACRPSDIVTSMSGKTIEILNTDAEGRLVLADALTYVQRTYKPKAIIDLATLTGAMMVALGYEYCGTFANDDGLWQNLETASTETGEKLWRMPLDEAWKKDMQGSITDLQNLGKTGRYAGACTAAGFLEHFIEENTPWAHMDIAGTAWIKADRPTVPRYGTGFAVRTLDRMIANAYEKK